MKIGVLSLHSHVGGGLFQYTQAVIRALDNWNIGEKALFLSKDTAAQMVRGLKSDWQVVIFPKDIPVLSMSGGTQDGSCSVLVKEKGFNRRLRNFLCSFDVSLMLYPAPSFYSFEAGIPYLTAVHDLQHRLQPEFPEVSAEGEWFRREYLFANSVHFASGVLVDSEVGKEDVLNCYGDLISAEKVFPLPYTCALEVNSYRNVQQNRSVKEKYQLPDKYLYYPAQFWLHKNHARLIHALHNLRVEYGLEIPLVLTGSNTGPRHERRDLVFQNCVTLSRQLGVADLIHYLGYVPEEDVPALYSMAVALVFPTFFGPTNIPIIEAWHFDCPVITSDIRGVREQVGDAALLVDPFSAESIQQGMLLLWQDEKKRMDLIEKGRKKIQESSFDLFRENLFNIIERASKDLPLLRVGESSKGEVIVSAIVSTYNSEKFLAGCLQDLENQTIADHLEIIVVDSGSEQNERAIVETFQRQYSNIIYIRTEERETIYAAWNRAIRIARGKYITNANTDDRHHPQAFEKMIQVLEQDERVGVVYFDSAVTRQENSNLETAPLVGRFRWPEFDRKLLFQVCFIGPQPMWRRELHEKYGLFGEDYKVAGDYDFWLRVSDKTEFFHIPEVLGLYYESLESVEHQFPQYAAVESERAREKYWRAEDGSKPHPGGYYLERFESAVAIHQLLEPPLVSVVVPTYNRPQYLQRALASIAQQSYSNLEVIVVNDAGEDVRGVIRDFEKERAIRYIVHEHNQGAGAARNTGFSVAQGKYITFLDDDDVFYPHHIRTLVDCLEKNNREVVAAYTDAIEAVFDYSTESPKEVERKVTYSEDFNFENLLAYNYIPILTLMFRREVLASVGGFDTGLAALEDWEWLIRLASAGKFVHVPVVTAEYEVKQRGTSRNQLTLETIQKLYLEIYRRHHSLRTSALAEKCSGIYRAMVGRDLRADAPDLFQSEVSARDGRTVFEFSPEKILAYVRGLLERNDMVSAENWLQRAVASFPQDVMLLNTYGTVLGKLGKLREAQLVFQRLVALQPNSVLAYSNLASVLVMAAELEAAEKIILQALRLDPSDEISNRLYNLIQQKKIAADSKVVEDGYPDHYPSIFLYKAIFPSGVKFRVTNPTERYRVTEEEEDVRFLLEKLSSRHILFDIGACIGVYSLHAARKCRQVFAFEPDVGFRQHLERNIMLNELTNVIVIPWAVSDKGGVLKLFTDGTAGKSPSLVNTGFTEEVEVETYTLDEKVNSGELPAPDVIKMDIEGAEILALRGMVNLLNSHLPKYVFIEIHPKLLLGFSSTKEEVLDIFSAAGYQAIYQKQRDLEEHYLFSPVG